MQGQVARPQEPPGSPGRGLQLELRSLLVTLWAKTQTSGSPQTRAPETGKTLKPASGNSIRLTCVSEAPHTSVPKGAGQP